MIKIKLHSFTDLITNSSTVIFTYSDGSEVALKEMVEEFFKSFGVDKKFDEVFKTVVLCDDSYRYSEYLDKFDDEDYPEGITKDTDIDQLYRDVASGKVEKPEWFNTVEEEENDYDYFAPSTDLYIIPLSTEYEPLAKAIRGFLYSTSHEATRDG